MGDFSVGSNGMAIGSGIGGSFDTSSVDGIGAQAFESNGVTNGASIMDASSDDAMQSFNKSTQQIAAEFYASIFDLEEAQQEEEAQEEKAGGLINLGEEILIDYDGDGIWDAIEYAKPSKEKEAKAKQK